MCCWLVKLSAEGRLVRCGKVKKLSDSEDQMVDLLTEPSSAGFQAFRCVRRKFSDTIQRLQRRVDLQSCARNRRSFCTVQVACKDGEVDEDLERPAATKSCRANDTDCQGSKTDLRVRLCSPCWPCQPTTRF